MNGFENKEVLDEIQRLDIQEYLDALDLYKQIIKNNSTGCFQVLYWKKLPYAGKAIKLKNEKFNTAVTAVRSVMYVPD